MSILNDRTRFLAGCALACCALGVMGLSISDHINQAHRMGESPYDIPVLVLCLMIMGIAALVMRPVSVRDYLAAANQARFREAERRLPWVGLETVRIPFRDLSRGSQAFVLFCYAFTAFALCSASGDLMGWMPEVSLTRPDGGQLLVPRPLTAGLAVLAALFSVLLAEVMRYQLVDTIDRRVVSIFRKAGPRPGQAAH